MGVSVKLKKKMSVHVDFRAKDDNSLEVDFGALDLSTPHLTLPSSIGNGMQFVSKFMSSKLSDKPESMKPLLDYLLALNYRGEVRISAIISQKLSKYQN
jgi:sucrose synthase